MAIKDILRNAHPAVCGIMEKEVVVPKEQTDTTIQELQEAGFNVIGKSLNGSQSRKVWFIRPGGF